MKRLAVFVAVGMVAGAGLASAQISGSVHDFSDGAGVMSDTWNHSTNSAGTKQICGPCHHPHSPNNASQPPPLWDQLKPGGRMVIPIGGQYEVQRLVLVTKQEDGSRRSRTVLSVRFVPLTREGDR